MKDPDLTPIERLRKALIGAWVGYDAVPTQLAETHFDNMISGNLTPYNEGVRPCALYQLTAVDVAAIEAGIVIKDRYG